MQAVSLYHTASGNAQRGICRAWQPPTKNTIKLNTDGSSNSEMVAGCGGILRDHEGKWRGGFSKFVGRGNALLAECWGLLEGIMLTQRLGYTRVEINVDSSQLVEAINKGTVGQMDCIALLRQILMELNKMEVVIISHVYRSANACADALAKIGSRESNTTFYIHVPEALKEFLDRDNSGFLGYHVAPV